MLSGQSRRVRLRECVRRSRRFDLARTLIREPPVRTAVLLGAAVEIGRGVQAWIWSVAWRLAARHKVRLDFLGWCCARSKLSVWIESLGHCLDDEAAILNWLLLRGLRGGAAVVDATVIRLNLLSILDAVEDPFETFAAPDHETYQLHLVAPMVQAQVLLELFAASGHFGHGHDVLALLHQIDPCAANDIQAGLDPNNWDSHMQLINQILYLLVDVFASSWLEFDGSILEEYARLVLDQFLRHLKIFRGKTDEMFELLVAIIECLRFSESLRFLLVDVA